MIADTKTVRKFMRALGMRAHWTEKSKGNADKSVRIIVGYARDASKTELLNALRAAGYDNKVYTTGTAYNNVYLRVKTRVA